MADTTGSIRLARKFAETSSSLLSHASLERTLQAVAELAPANVHAAASASVSVVGRDGVIETPAYTDARAVDVDRIQSALEEGPALQAAAEGLLLRIDDTATDVRWPAFAERAAELGVRSMIVRALPLGNGLRAALVLHSSEPMAFDGHAVDAADVYAAHASAALAKSHAADSLRTAVHSRQLIGEATGILMERHRIDSPKAFELLVRASQDLNIKLKVVAEQVVHTGQDPHTLLRRDVPADRSEVPRAQPTRAASTSG